MNETEKSNIPKKESNDNYYPAEKSHWERYKLYYLVFGSFFLLLVVILISNSTTNRQIRKINERLDGKIYSSLGFGYSSKMAGYSSRLENEPFPDYVKKRVKEEIEKINKSSFSSSHTKEDREE